MKILGILFNICFLFAGSAFPQAKVAQSHEQEIGLLKSQIEFLRENITELQNDLTNAWAKIFEVEDRIDKYKEIEIDPSQKGFQLISTSIGSFLISVIDVLPFLDGYKVSLDIGNPSSASFSGFKLKAKWGKKWVAPPKFSRKDYDIWKNSLKEKEVEFTDRLVPGVWNRAELILTPASSQDLGYFKLSMETDNVFLRVK